MIDWSIGVARGGSGGLSPPKGVEKIFTTALDV